MRRRARKRRTKPSSPSRRDGARLIAGLAAGELSEADLAWAKSYERATFDELANLNPARDGAPVGHAA